MNLKEGLWETCEICDSPCLKDCRSCTLSGDPNPEAFTRQEIIDALWLKLTVDEIKRNIKSES